MRKKRRKLTDRQNKPRIQGPTQFPHLPYSPPLLHTGNPEKLIGMFSIKTIRRSDGTVVVRKGERISEDVLTAEHIEEVLHELIANAMPHPQSK